MLRLGPTAVDAVAEDARRRDGGGGVVARSLLLCIVIRDAVPQLGVTGGNWGNRSDSEGPGTWLNAVGFIDKC